MRASDICVELQVHPYICYALQHIGIPFANSLTVTNQGNEVSQNLVVELALLPKEFGAAWVGNVAELAAGESRVFTDIALPLSLTRLRQMQEAETAQYQISVHGKDETLYVHMATIQVLAYNEWLHRPDFLEITAAFIQPNSPALSSVLNSAARHLENATGSTAFCGYQSVSKLPGYVLQMLQAIHKALAQDVGLSYIDPPASFQTTGQKVLFAAQMLAQGRGTCIDLALLQAALWERIGLYPAVIIVPGHAFVACWLQDQHSTDPVVSLNGKSAAAEKLRKAIAEGTFLPVNSVEITAEMDFDQAIENARAYLTRHSGADDVHVIDVRAARQGKRPVLPLPEAALP